LYDFGDGTNSNSSDPTHLYPSAGVYQVEQFVTNVFGCMDSLTVDVLVYPQPEAGFINNTVCALDIVNFSDTTLGTPTTWDWDFGDGVGASNAQNPSYTYPLGGTYSITLIAGNSVGCLDTTIVDIEVYTNPVAAFEADTVCFLEVTTFTDLSNDVVPIVSWFYDFGDGINNSNLQNPTYIYQAPGLYPAELTVTNINGCSTTVQVGVVVNNIPVADFDFDTVCWGSPTTFTDISSGSVNSWNWDFGDGTTSTVGPVVQHTYANPGTYLVSMEVDGGSNCTDIIYYAVTVINVLTPSIGGDDTVCVNELVQFNDLSVSVGTPVTAWSWDFGDGTGSALQNPTHVYGAAGIYIVTLDVQTATGCTSQGVFTLEVFDLPTAAFDFTIPCEGQPTIFTDNSSDPNGFISSWQWTFGDGSPLSNLSDPEHQYAVAGDYPVTQIITSNHGCSDTLTQTVTIYPSPTADFIYSTECGGLPVPFLNQSVGNIVSFAWIYNGQTFSTDENPSQVFPTNTDTHPVTLVVTTDLGCIDSLTQDVITHPVVLFDYGPEITAGCPVLEVQFTDNSVTTGGGGIVNWLWDMGDSTYSFSSDPIHFYEDEGSYYISLQVITAEDCIYYDTLSYAVIVYPQPTAGFFWEPEVITMLNPEVEFTNTSIGAMDVEWNFGDFDYSNDWDPVHMYQDTGYYEVTQIVYNAYGCSDTISKWIYIYGDLVLYLPNTFTPNGDGVNDFFNLSGAGFESFELLIFDRWGVLIKTITDLNDAWDGSYRGARCQDGVYTWKLRAVDFEEIPHVRTGHVTILR
jgi:gliding motility-associated-like protein